MKKCRDSRHKGMYAKSEFNPDKRDQISARFDQSALQADFATAKSGLKIIFFGLGSIGQRHAKIIQDKYNFKLYAFRSQKNSEKNHLGIEEVFSWKAVQEIKPQLAFITNPTCRHIDTALKCAREGMHLFIEKPLDCQLRNLGELSKIVARKRLTSYVAYCLRFSSVVNKLKSLAGKYHFLHMRAVASSYYPAWRRGIDFKKNYSAYRHLGGGVVYDLSHELDYVQYILGDIKRIKAQFEKRGDLTVDSEDYADFLVETKKGPANVHINFLSHIPQRIVQMDFKELSVVGDILRNEIQIVRHGRASQIIRFKENFGQCYERQLSYFFSNLNNPRMMNNIFEAARFFKKIYSVKTKRFYG